MGLGGVAIVILPSIMCLKLTFSDGLGGYYNTFSSYCSVFDAIAHYILPLHLPASCLFHVCPRAVRRTE